MKQMDPTAADVTLWLKHTSRKQLHNEGWIRINQRFHGIARAVRPYLQTHFPEAADQEAAFDGFTLALLAVAHFEDIEDLAQLLKTDPEDM